MLPLVHAVLLSVRAFADGGLVVNFVFAFLQFAPYLSVSSSQTQAPSTARYSQTPHTVHHASRSVPPFSDQLLCTAPCLSTHMSVSVPTHFVGWEGSVGIATRYGLAGLGIEYGGGGQIFRTRPDLPWGTRSLLYNGYRVFRGVKRPRRGVDHPTPSADVKERVELYLYPPPGPTLPVTG
jgi:hypothetical protein